MTLKPLRPWSLTRIFFGLISAWMIEFLKRQTRHWSIECANSRTYCRLNPWKLLRLINSYKFIPRGSNVMQTWSRYTKFSNMRKMFIWSSWSWALRMVNIRISARVDGSYSVWFRIIFSATYERVLWSKTFKTRPKFPCPIVWRTS